MKSLFCTQCTEVTEFDVDNPNVGGLGYMSLKCKICFQPVAQCNECLDVYSLNFRKHTNIRKHMKIKHKPLNAIADDQDDNEVEDHSHDENNNESDEGTSTFLDIDYHDAIDILDESFNPIQSNFEDHKCPDFGNNKSNIYFEQDLKMYHNEGALFGGIRGVCWRSRYQLDLYDVEHIADIDDAEFMFNITELLMKNPASSNKLLYKVLSEMTERMAEDFDSANPHVRIPRNDNDARKTCLEGQYGIFNNLPCPNIHTVGGHACMKIEDVIAQHMAQGRGFEFTESPPNDASDSVTRIYHEIHGCVAMDDLIYTMKSMNSSSQPTYYGWFTTWSDSFLRSYVKQKLNNVWMYTITLPDPDRNATSPFHTYCVAVGAGALDHTSVIDWYSKEIEVLMKGKDYYCGLRNQIVHAQLGVVAALADRPEKSFTLKTALLGVYGQIASWAAEIEPDVLADCKKCFQRRCDKVMQDRHSQSNLPPCQLCCQWDLNSKSRARTRVKVPDKYPTKCDDNSPTVPAGREMSASYIAPVRQTFSWLKEAVLFAAHNVSVGAWNKGVMEAYLRTCSIAGSVRDNIWRSCRPSSSDSEHNENETNGEPENDGEINDGFTPIVGEHSNVVPAIWYSSLMMNAYLDCGMHLVFHGIVSYCVERMDEFMADHGLTQKFERLANVYLLDIQGLRLDWCKMKYFPKKQWLGENELGLARIIPFVYGIFFLNFDLPARCNTSKNTELSIMQMFHSMHVMICILMSPRDPLADEIDEHVKIFLSCCHRFSRSYYNKEVKPFWSNTGNFPTLLCLAEQRRQHGPIRWYWEGTSERFIQKLKKVLTSMRKTTTYFRGKLGIMYKMNVMEWLSEEFDKADSNRDQDSEKRVPRMYYQYKTLEEIERKIMLGEVLSGFTFHGNSEKIVIAYGGQRRSGLMNCIGITRLNKGTCRKCVGLAFVKCKLDEETNILSNVSVSAIENRIEHHLLMLPLIDHGDFDEEYAIVFDDWDVSDENFVKCLPKLCDMCFEIDVLL